MNQKNGEITVSVPGRERIFPNREALKRFVVELRETRGGLYSELEYVAIRTLASLNGGVTPPPSDPPTPPEPTPFDDRCAVLDQEEKEDEARYAESKEAWLSRLQELRAEAPRRFHRARNNSAKLGRLQTWKQERAAELASLEFAFQKADRKLQRARGRANLLRLARDRWRAEQECRVVYEGQEVSLAEFTELREREAR